MKLLDRLRGIKDKAADTAGEHSDKVKEGIDRAGEFVDEKTGGKHADKIDQATEKAKDATDSFTGDQGDQGQERPEGRRRREP